MDHKLFADIIKEVLVREDKACLPGLGTFVTEEVPAFFSDKGFAINPPYRKLVFDTNSTVGDGLVEFYAISNDIPVSKARLVIDGYVSDLARDLYATKQVELPGLGRLRATRGNDVFFVAAEDLSIFPQYDYLQTVSLRNLSQDPAPSAPVASPVNITEADMPSEVVVPSEADMPSEVVVPSEAEMPSETVVPSEADVPAQAPEEEASSETTELIPEPLGHEGGSADRHRWFGIAMLILAVVALLSFAALAILGRTCPELIDPLLYNAAELEIINCNL